MTPRSDLPAAEHALREYLRCGIPAHGFARVRCASCKHEYLVDEVLPRVPHRQWVLAVPKRVRWHIKHDTAAVDGFAKVFPRLIETTLRQASFHVLGTDGVFSADPQDATRAEFCPATNLDALAELVVESPCDRKKIGTARGRGALNFLSAKEVVCASS